jgi:cell fate regulator YaaT (PSP1 superfamily)
MPHHRDGTDAGRPGSNLPFGDVRIAGTTSGDEPPAAGPAHSAGSSHHHGHDHDHGHAHGSDSERRPAKDPTNLAEQMVSPTLRGRESECTHGCGSGGECGSGDCGNGCMTGGCGVGSIVDLIASDFAYSDGRRIIEVTYKGYRREFVEVTDEDLPLRVRDMVIVEAERGVDIAAVSMTGSLVHAKRKAKRVMGETLATVLRKATPADLQTHARDHEAERKALDVCRARVEHFNLPMHLVGAEWQFDHRRVTFFFTADGRVDFRELVRDLASIFHTRIELRQIAVRDEAKRLGGMGICGRELCCTTHLGRYEHVTLDHAKAQQLQINPTKLSGLCGRLKCCLLYELDTYIDGLKRFPAIESTFFTAKGKGFVQKIDVFRNLLFVYHPEQHALETLTLDELHDLVPQQDELRRMRQEEARPAR